MVNATGSPLSAGPLLRATEKALSGKGEDARPIAPRKGKP
jgi:hypothetical protein